MKRRGARPVGRPKKKLAPKVAFSLRVKEEVLQFLKIGAAYHGVGFNTYLQWLLERALLNEIHYYGWGRLHPLGFDRPQTTEPFELREFLHLTRITRRRERKQAAANGPDDGAPST